MCSELEKYINNLTYVQMVEQVSYHALKLKTLPLECQSYVKNNLNRLGVSIENFEEDLTLHWMVK
jgi:hypothetical protein